MPETTGAAQESESTQIVFPVMLSERSSRRSRSVAFPWPERIRSRILVVQAVPSRHWVHWAHDSWARSEEHTSELQSQSNLVCRLLLEKKKKKYTPLPHPAD